MRIFITIVLALAAIAGILCLGLLLTVFSITKEFYFSSIASILAVIAFTIGILTYPKINKGLTIGSALFFSLCAATILLTHFGSTDEYVARMDISIPNWYFYLFYWSTYLCPIPILVALLRMKAPKPTQATSIS